MRRCIMIAISSAVSVMNPKVICSIAFAFALAACSKAPEAPPAPTADAVTKTMPNIAATNVVPAKPVHDDVDVAWRKGDVDAAFATAKAEGKPVFLYWGAVWCPPCNQVKATVFNRQDFIERSRFFVPVYIDGDTPSAQKLGARFKVGGYPTMILFNAQGDEITRLPGEVDADQYMRVLALGMNGARPVKDTLAAALGGVGGGAAALAPEDWRMLAYYSWDTDEQLLVPKKDVAATLKRLAQSCPAEQADTATRLQLKALVAAATTKDVKPRDDPAQVKAVMSVLADPKVARANFDLLTNYAGDIAGYVTLPASTPRAQLVAAWNAALAILVGDATLSTADRLTAVAAQVELAKLDAGKAALPEPLLHDVRDQVARADRETSDAYARQSVISAGADVLAEAGLLDESDTLLTAELKRSHSPYYFMLGLAANAKKRGDKAAAVDWAGKAYASSEGPATRLQWGATYVRTLVELTPQDSAGIEAAAAQVIGELDATPDTFFDRNRRALERIGKSLATWNKDKQHTASVQRIRAQMAGVCVKLPAADPARAACAGALRPAPARNNA
jgi:thiol-disulfide isomerase/thioredoxin